MNKKNVRKALKKFAKTTQMLSDAAAELWAEYGIVVISTAPEYSDHLARVCLLKEQWVEYVWGLYESPDVLVEEAGVYDSHTPYIHRRYQLSCVLNGVEFSCFMFGDEAIRYASIVDFTQLKEENYDD